VRIETDQQHLLPGHLATSFDARLIGRPHRPLRRTLGRAGSVHCREHLAAYKVPRVIQFVDSVPITASGKIMRRLLTDIDDGTR
jgi:acyl-coenzyme A synthetase/AMP-(fatty) acid ligase